MKSINNLLKKDNIKIFLIGIGGCGMSSIARMLRYEGYDVSGSDLCFSKMVKILNKEGINVFNQHNRDNIKGMSFVVFSSAIDDSNVELLEAKKLKIPIFHRTEILNYFVSMHKFRIGVMGTHGKGTVTGSIINCLESNLLDVNFFVGGILVNKKTNYSVKNKKEYFVVEIDESDGKFVNINLNYLLINNLSIDHMDYFGNFDNLLNKILDYINNSNLKKLYLNLSDSGCKKLYDLIDDKTNIITFGFLDNFDYNGKILSLRKPYYKGEFSNFEFMGYKFKTPLSAGFNINN